VTFDEDMRSDQFPKARLVFFMKEKLKECGQDVVPKTDIVYETVQVGDSFKSTLRLPRLYSSRSFNGFEAPTKKFAEHAVAAVALNELAEDPDGEDEQDDDDDMDSDEAAKQPSDVSAKEKLRKAFNAMFGYQPKKASIVYSSETEGTPPDISFNTTLTIEAIDPNVQIRGDAAPSQAKAEEQAAEAALAYWSNQFQDALEEQRQREYEKQASTRRDDTGDAVTSRLPLPRLVRS